MSAKPPAGPTPPPPPVRRTYTVRLAVGEAWLGGEQRQVRALNGQTVVDLTAAEHALAVRQGWDPQPAGS